MDVRIHFTHVLTLILPPRICALLEDWMVTYPGDFASPGAEPALQALIRQILSNSHTAHYAADFMPFLKAVPQLVDEDKEWGAKEKTREDEEESAGSDIDPADLDVDAGRPAPRAGAAMNRDGSEDEAASSAHPTVNQVTIEVTRGSTSRDTLPEGGESLAQKQPSPHHHSSPKGVETHQKQLSASSADLDGPSASAPVVTPGKGSVRSKGVVVANAEESDGYLSPHIQLPWFADLGSVSPTKGPRGPDALRGVKANIKELIKVSNALSAMEPITIAQEITSLEVPLFLGVMVGQSILAALQPPLISLLSSASRLAQAWAWGPEPDACGRCSAYGKVLQLYLPVVSDGSWATSGFEW